MKPLITQLREAATKATPGPWEHQTYSNYPNGYSVHAEPGCISERWQDGLSDAEAERLRNTGKYIALCSPENVLALCELAEAAKELAELANIVSVWMHTSGLQMPAQVDEDSYALGDKARAFLAKYFPKGEK